MKIFHSIPWNSEKNIGVYYNDFMSLLDKDDWLVFLMVMLFIQQRILVVI